MNRPKLPIATHLILFFAAGLLLGINFYEMATGQFTGRRTRIARQENPRGYWRAVGFRFVFATGLGVAGLFALSTKK